jgi:hypothetical protein
VRLELGRRGEKCEEEVEAEVDMREVVSGVRECEFIPDTRNQIIIPASVEEIKFQW